MSRFQRHQSKTLFATETAVNIRLFVFTLVSLVIMILDHRYHNLEQLRNSLSTAVYPLQYAVHLPTAAFGWFSERLVSRNELIAENARLRKKQWLINAQLQKLDALEAENRRLRMLLESSTQLREQVVIAELLAVDFDPYRHQILLNKGTLQGVHVGQPLLDQRGIVGQVIHANALTSTAILITDPNHALPVQVNRTGLRTLALGTGHFQALDLPHIPNNADIKVGDLLVTSGLGGRFPRGYAVATVSAIEFDPGHPFARITAQPSSQLDRSREVLLIATTPSAEVTAASTSSDEAP